MKAVAVRLARAEWGLLYETVRSALTRRRLRAIPVTVAAVCLAAVVHLVHQQSWGYRLIENVGAVRADDPLWLALLRTPLSLFVPALHLPVWGALAQILIVFGIAEICLGRRRTVALAYVATLTGTLYARVGIALGPDVLFVGLPASDARVVDTGPSAAVVGLAVFVGLRHRAYVTAGAVALAMVVEVLAKENLAGKEHLAAIAAVLVVYGVVAVRQRRSAGPDGRDEPAGPAGPDGPYGPAGPDGPAPEADSASGVPPIQF
ncbi:collagen-like protein [Streptomyces sp. CA-210063]|nr:collagen-like protein [Streptomyces sp. CA-210063]